MRKTKNKITFSQSELQAKFEEDFDKTLTRQRLHQLRNGYKVRGKEYEPKLIEGKHYHWERGNVKYFMAAYELIKKQSTKLTLQN